MTGENTTS